MHCGRPVLVRHEVVEKMIVVNEMKIKGEAWGLFVSELGENLGKTCPFH